MLGTGHINCWELHFCGFCSVVGATLIGSACSGCFHRASREPLYPHHQLVHGPAPKMHLITLILLFVKELYCFIVVGTQWPSRCLDFVSSTWENTKWSVFCSRKIFLVKKSLLIDAENHINQLIKIKEERETKSPKFTFRHSLHFRRKIVSSLHSRSSSSC